jgi:nucleotide-binding universal stress UspA family protein
MRDGDYDLIVMGVSRRPGDTLFFGSTAAAVLENSQQSMVFISGQRAAPTNSHRAK